MTQKLPKTLIHQAWATVRERMRARAIKRETPMPPAPTPEIFAVLEVADEIARWRADEAMRAQTRRRRPNHPKQVTELKNRQASDAAELERRAREAEED